MTTTSNGSFPSSSSFPSLYAPVSITLATSPGGDDADATSGGRPSAPSPGLVLFNTEEQSDIVFNVGTDLDPYHKKDGWRFPAHSFIVADASPVFEALIQSQRRAPSLPGSKPEIFIHCQPEVFHVMLSFIYKNEVNITSVSSGLSLLMVANQFMLNDLSKACLTFLNRHVGSSNVLEVLSYLRQAGQEHGQGQEPTFLSQTSSFGDNVLNELITKCYHILDDNAEKILGSEAVDSLEQEMLIDILSRDSLRVSSELIVFECLSRWSCNRCLRERRELIGENMRDVLGKGVYSARYLVMTIDEFMKGPYISDLLSEEDKSCLWNRLSGDSAPARDLLMHLKGRKLDIRRKYLKPTGMVSPSRRPPDENSSSPPLSPNPPRPGDNLIHSKNTITSNNVNNALAVNRKKNSTSKKLRNGLSGIIFCVIQLLD